MLVSEFVLCVNWLDSGCWLGQARFNAKSFLNAKLLCFVWIFLQTGDILSAMSLALFNLTC